MPSRYLKCDCLSCPVIFRMTRVHIDSADDGLSCPRCGGRVLVEDDKAPAPTEADRDIMADVCASVAMTAEEEELEKRRVHIAKRRGSVYTREEVQG